MRSLPLLLLLGGCAATSTGGSISASTSPAPRLVAANSGRSVWVGSAPLTQPRPSLPSGRRAVWVSTTACVMPVAAGDRAEHAPAFDPKRCIGLVERVLVDGDVVEDRVERVEELTIEDVAVKLEALLRARTDVENSD